jgi:pre-rRNA-processing protein TSR1
MSSYQADWFVDEEGNFDENEANGNDSDDDVEEGAVAMKTASSSLKKERTTVRIDVTKGGDDHDIEVEDGESDNEDGFSLAGSILNAQTGTAAVEEKKRIRAMAKEDQEFPDEMDTPADVSARQRFGRYRALQSFRSSPWHPKENLPQDYARIFQFENFGATQRR